MIALDVVLHSRLYLNEASVQAASYFFDEIAMEHWSESYRRLNHHQNHWPFEPVDDLCAAIFEAFHFGGGPIFVSDRHDHYPSVAHVHDQLVEMFNKIKNSIKSHLPDTARYGYDVDTLPACYDNATSCDLVAWDHGGKHYQLVCYLSPDGGSIDAILERKAEWHKIG